jgi:hypothetical protein
LAIQTTKVLEDIVIDHLTNGRAGYTARRSINKRTHHCAGDASKKRSVGPPSEPSCTAPRQPVQSLRKAIHGARNGAYGSAGTLSIILGRNAIRSAFWESRYHPGIFDARSHDHDASVRVERRDSRFNFSMYAERLIVDRIPTVSTIANAMRVSSGEQIGGMMIPFNIFGLKSEIAPTEPQLWSAEIDR